MGRPILVVDDNAETRAALVAVLHIRGYETVTARDGLDALAQLRAGLRPALILLDWMMPNLDGRGFLEQTAVDPQLRRIPVVLYSALGHRIFAGGVTAIVSKSDNPETLLEVVERLAKRDGGNGDSHRDS